MDVRNDEPEVTVDRGKDSLLPLKDLAGGRKLGPGVCCRNRMRGCCITDGRAPWMDLRMFELWSTMANGCLEHRAVEFEDPNEFMYCCREYIRTRPERQQFSSLTNQVRDSTALT